MRPYFSPILLILMFPPFLTLPTSPSRSHLFSHSPLLSALQVSSSLEISLVDGRPRELMTLTLDGLALEYKSGVTGGVDFTSVHATLKSAQLDDQLPGSPYPVVLLPLAEAEALVHPSPFGSARGGGKRGGGGGGDRAEPLLYFSFVSEPGRKKGALYCPCIVAKLAPVKISVAESLVWRMVAFASALTAAAEAASQSDPVANTVAAARASSSSALRSAMGGSGSNASIGARSTRLEGGGSGLPLQVDFLNIEDMELSLRLVGMKDAMAARFITHSMIFFFSDTLLLFSFFLSLIL